MEKRADPMPKSPRELFIDEVIRPLGVSETIIDAFARVDRAEFVPEGLKYQAYNDTVITLGRGSSISQPSLVAIMLDALQLLGDETVLEIGTATGFQASLLSLLSKEVHTIDINPKLTEQADQNVKRLGYNNITLHTGDGASGLPGKVFDRIIITAAVKEVPSRLMSQLAEGGIIVAPVGESMEVSQVTVFTKSQGKLSVEPGEKCVFTPLVTETPAGWSETEIADKQREKLANTREEMSEFLEAVAANYGTTTDILFEIIGSELGYVLRLEHPLDEKQVIDAINIVFAIFSQLEGKAKEDEPETE